MTRRRWIADSWGATSAVLTGEHAAHLSRVLRARVGQQFEIVAGEQVRLGRIESVSDERVVFVLGEKIDAVPALPLFVLLSVFKFDRFEWAVEKLTELGVAEIQPVIAARTDAHLAASALKRTERWRRIVVEASQQSRRSTAPVVHDPIPLKSAVSLKAFHKVLLAETEKQTSLTAVLESLAPLETDADSSMYLSLAVGPEGGWTDPELQLFDANGWRRATLGTTILRAETAAIAAVAVTAAWFFR